MAITYKAYIIDAYEREHESVTTSADALTAVGAIDLAKQGIDGGGMI